MTGPVAYLHGRFVPLAEASISIADAGFVFGATVTDFARTYGGQLFRWPQHLARLRHDAHSLGIALELDDPALTAISNRLLAHHATLWPGQELAIITFATAGPLAHFAVGLAATPTLGMHAFPIHRDRYRRFFQTGVVLHPMSAAPDPLPSVKHRSRLRWWLADQALRSDPDVPAGALPLLIGADGSLMETAVGSLLLVIAKRVVTPAPPAVLESISVGVVADLCRDHGWRFERRAVSWQDVETADEALLTGTAFGLAGVRQLGQRQFPWPGPWTQRLQQSWADLTGVHPAHEFADGVA